MYSKVNQNNFMDTMKKFVGWDYYVLSVLFEYLESEEDSIGEEREFDPIELRCEFSFYETREEIENDYGMTWEEIESNTMVIQVEQGGYIIREF